MNETKCPVCGQPAPTCELASYRMCESCFVGQRPTGQECDTKRHQLGGDDPYPADRRGGAGQDASRGKTS